MLKSFQIDCVQLNPHLNYLKVTPLLKISIIILMRQVEGFVKSDKFASDGAFEDDDLCEEFVQLTENLNVYLKCVKNLRKIALLYVEARLIDKFEVEFLLKNEFCLALLGLLEMMIHFARFHLKFLSKLNAFETVLESISYIMDENMLRIVLNQNDDFQQTQISLIELCHEFADKLLENSHLGLKYEHPPVFKELVENGCYDEVAIYQKVVKVGRFLDLNQDDGLIELISNRKYWRLKVTFCNILLQFCHDLCFFLLF